jgi:gliding motility-associated-like protein
LNPIVSPDFTTNYTVVVTTLNGCVDEADIRVIVDRRVNVYIPNAFSPHNNDGTNDRFMIFARDGSVSKIDSLMVFNRWGESVFEAYNFPPNDPTYGWDGTFRGVKMNAAVFAYWTEVELIDGSTVILKGDVNLID